MSEIKMNPDAKAKIVAALRSGEYQQTRDYMKNEDGCMCVWGVICDVSGLHQWEPQITLGGANVFGYGGDWAFPPLDVAKWAGNAKHAEDLKVELDGKTHTLMWHNDAGATFAQLADTIEQQL